MRVNNRPFALVMLLIAVLTIGLISLYEMNPLPRRPSVGSYRALRMTEMSAILKGIRQYREQYGVLPISITSIAPVGLPSEPRYEWYTYRPTDSENDWVLMTDNPADDKSVIIAVLPDKVVVRKRESVPACEVTPVEAPQSAPQSPPPSPASRPQ